VLKVAFCVLFGGCACNLGFSADFNGNRDSTALTILSGASNALNGITAINSAILTGTATYAAGSDELTGGITLEGSGPYSKVLLSLSDGARSEVQGDTDGVWSGVDGVQHRIPLNNSLGPSSWFFPPLLVNTLIADRSFSISGVAAENRNGIAVQHIQFARTPAGQSDATTIALLQQASQTDLYLDSATNLPVALEFSTHPNDNALQDIHVRIEFGDYRTVGQIKAPFHISKYLQNTLLLDISINSIEVNPAVPASDFSIN
jgi:hypothetical protein